MTGDEQANAANEVNNSAENKEFKNKQTQKLLDAVLVAAEETEGEALVRCTEKRWREEGSRG